MIVNLSNHPSHFWGEKQKQAALDQFGSVGDIAFPNIPPAADWADVARIAKDYFRKVVELGDHDHVTVHLMGEITFVCALRALLKNAGYKVVCSTTERNTVELPDGKKITQFEFVRFRGYN